MPQHSSVKYALPAYPRQFPLTHGQENTCDHCDHIIYWENTYKVWRHLKTHNVEC